jgi:hypothetical protein
MVETGKAVKVMESKTKDEAVLRKYLLGSLSPQEQEEIDLWLLSCEDAYDLLEAAEDDLIDASLNGRLRGRDLDSFNSYFLAAPERQQKLRFSRAFKRAIEAFPQAAPEESGSRQPSTWLRFLDAFRPQPAFAFAASALIAILVIGSVWSVFKVAELQQELRSARDQVVTVVRDRDDLKRQLDESQTTARNLEAELRTLKAAPTTGKPAAEPVLLAVNLIPGITRSARDVSRITLTPATSLVRFSLALLDDNFPNYRVSLMNADMREIWSQDRLPATSSREGKAVVVNVPAQLLANGDYSFGLMGVSRPNNPENIARYYFHALRQ